MRELFDFVLEVGLRFGRAQVEAGAEVIGIGDPAASLIGPRLYREFVWSHEKRLVKGLRAGGARVRLHICGNTRRILGDLGKLGCDIVDIDSAVPVAEARAQMGDAPVLLGGIDPVRTLQNGGPADIEAALAACRKDAGPRYIAGAGCEIPRGTPVENVHEMVHFASKNA